MNTSRTLIYDGSFNGFLTAVFFGFQQKLQRADIQIKGQVQNDLFTETETIFTNIEIAKRVWNGIRNRSNPAIKNIYFAFLSESKGIEPLLYHYIQKLMRTNEKEHSKFSNDCILKIEQLAHKVSREKHRMEAFIRFQQTKDEVYFAPIEPDFDVLPLISKYFRSRYKDQQWLIFDVKRNYGLFYNLDTVEMISLDVQDICFNSFLKSNVVANEKHDVLELWNNTIQNTHIKLRINEKLHTPHAPKSYVQYTSEKKEAV